MKIAMALTINDLIRTLRLTAHRIAERPRRPAKMPKRKTRQGKRGVR